MYSIAIATYRAVLRVPYRKASTLLTIYIYTEDDGLVHSGRSRREKGKGSYQPREGEDREVSTTTRDAEAVALENVLYGQSWRCWVSVNQEQSAADLSTTSCACGAGASSS
jgi:hypothetical protein